MSKRYLIVLILGMIGLIVLISLIPVSNHSQGLMSSIQKGLMNNYGGTTEKELHFILDKQKVDQPSLINIIKYAINQGVSQGIAPTLVLILFSLPLIGTLSDIFHYMIGLEGYGIYMPTLIVAAFWSIGIIGGLILFLFILAFSLIARNLLYRIKLHYWPRRSISLWIVILFVFLFISLFAQYLFINPAYISAFSILFLILLSEEHISTQRRKGIRVALRRTSVTLFLAIISSLILSWYPFQKIILTYPEAFMLSVLCLGFIVGRYTGFRLLEYHRFSSVIREEDEEE